MWWATKQEAPDFPEQRHRPAAHSRRRRRLRRGHAHPRLALAHDPAPRPDRAPVQGRRGHHDHRLHGQHRAARPRRRGAAHPPARRPLQRQAPRGPRLDRARAHPRRRRARRAVPRAQPRAVERGAHRHRPRRHRRRPARPRADRALRLPPPALARPLRELRRPHPPGRARVAPVPAPVGRGAVRADDRGLAARGRRVRPLRPGAARRPQLRRMHADRRHRQLLLAHPRRARLRRHLRRGRAVRAQGLRRVRRHRRRPAGHGAVRRVRAGDHRRADPGHDALRRAQDPLKREREAEQHGEGPHLLPPRERAEVRTPTAVATEPE